MICINQRRAIVLVILLGFGVQLAAADPSGTSALIVQGGPSASNPSDLQPATLTEAFSAIRLMAEQGEDWDSVLVLVDQAVRRHSSDPTATIQAVELLGELFPAVPDRWQQRDGKAWGDFSLEYSQQIAGHAAVNGTTETGHAIRASSALRLLASVLESVQPNEAAGLFLVVGQLGRNLHANPAYPREAVAGLASFALAEAHGLALLGRGEEARQLLETAYAWGLVDFEEVFDDAIFQKCSTSAAIIETTRLRQAAYLAQIQPGIDAAIASFMPFSFDFALPSMSGSRVNKTHFSSELTVVDIWGTWCAPCRASLPHLARLHREFAGKGVRVVGIAMEPDPTIGEIQAKLTAFAERHDVTWDLLVGNDAVLEQIPGGGSLPTLVFLDSRGQVRFSIAGYHDYSQIKTIVERLLASPPLAAR